MRDKGGRDDDKVDNSDSDSDTRVKWCVVIS